MEVDLKLGEEWMLQEIGMEGTTAILLYRLMMESLKPSTVSLQIMVDSPDTADVYGTYHILFLSSSHWYPISYHLPLKCCHLHVAIHCHIVYLLLTHYHLHITDSHTLLFSSFHQQDATMLIHLLFYFLPPHFFYFQYCTYTLGIIFFNGLFFFYFSAGMVEPN